MTNETVHILAVEDDPAHAELIRRAFDYATSPMRLSVASTLADARRSMAERAPDLMIVDMVLPDGQGTELLPGDPDKALCPMVIMTSHGDEQMAVDALKAGALDYVVKSSETLTDMPHIAERTLREWGHIRERRLAEAALRQSEERLQAILDNATVPYVIDGDGNCHVYVDASADLDGSGWHATMNYAGFSRPTWSWRRPRSPRRPR